jgi:hypothetical protein
MPEAALLRSRAALIAATTSGSFIDLTDRVPQERASKPATGGRPRAFIFSMSLLTKEVIERAAVEKLAKRRRRGEPAPLFRRKRWSPTARLLQLTSPSVSRRARRDDVEVGSLLDPLPRVLSV